MPTPEELAALEQASIEDLETQPVVAASDDDVEAARKRSEQTHTFRDSFYPTVRWTLVCVLGSSAVVMGLYLVSEWGQLDPTVMISFNAAVVANTIGLAYIVAKHLFPSDPG